ncbi:DUF2878 domain-containing protein [Thalassotalea sp. PLHSN55]|uniref:DUF2878 domain-containing protein n=1 Tax=Thalassotalea sp. PLHSN55 TaxID=3435888 RepID=UPI003F8690BD
MTINHALWLNLIAFNLIWFALVLLGNTFVIPALVWLVAHLYFSGQAKAETLLILSVSAIGIGLDNLLTDLAVFNFSDSNRGEHFNTLNAFLTSVGIDTPIWLMALWLCFSATIAHSLKFLHHKTAWQFIAGGVFAPLSYLAGHHLGAVDFGYSNIVTVLLLSLVWAPLMCLFFALLGIIFQQEKTHV